MKKKIYDLLSNINLKKVVIQPDIRVIKSHVEIINGKKIRIIDEAYLDSISLSMSDIGKLDETD